MSSGAANIERIDQMFYLKKTIGNDIEMNIDIFEDEIFTRCGGCGKEMPVEVDVLIHVLEEGDLAGCSVFCKECAEKRKSKNGQSTAVEEPLPVPPEVLRILADLVIKNNKLMLENGLKDHIIKDLTPKEDSKVERID